MSNEAQNNANATGAGSGKIPDTASKTPQVVSLNTKVMSFQDVQRSLEEVKSLIEQLNAKQIPSSLSDESETEGAPGSIRIIKTDTGNNLFEIKTELGWQKPMVGQTQVTFKPIESNVKETTPKSIDELEAADATTGDKIAEKTIFDEKADKFVMARPDYTSGWVAIDATSSNGGTLVHDLGVIPSFGIMHKCRTSAYNNGDPNEVQIEPVLGCMFNTSWAAYYGPNIHFTKTNAEWWVHNNGYGFVNYGSITKADSGTVSESGYFKLLLWK